MSHANERKQAGVLTNLGIGRAPGMPAGLAPRQEGNGAQQIAERGAFLRRVPAEQIEPDPEQPRKHFDEAELEEMADSLRARGQLQAITVYRDEGRGAYLIVFGERRWRGARIAGLSHLDCKVLAARPGEAELRAMQLVENLQRSDLKPCERAEAFRALMDAQGWSANQLAKELGLPQQSVASALSLLKLPAEVRGRIDRGELAPTIGHELARLDDGTDRDALLARIETEGLKRDDVADQVKTLRAAGGRGRPKSRGAGARPPQKKVLKVAGGRVTIERPKGIDAAFIALVIDSLRPLAEPAEPPNAEAA